MPIIYKLYSELLNEKFKEAIQRYQEDMKGLVVEEIVIQRSKIVDEVMGNNSAMVIRSLREDVVNLQKLYDELVATPLLANTKSIANYRKDDVDEISETLILTIQGNKEEN